MKVGTEWLVDAEGCAAALLGDVFVLRRVCERLLAELDLHPVRSGRWHQFPPPGGLTGLYLLTESHLACHTYPEHRIATFNLYCCRSRPTWPWEGRLREMLQAAAVTVRSMPRGGESTRGADALAARKEDAR